jgi:hypothetical protein
VLGVPEVLHECRNPVCKKPFVKIGEGKLFRVEANGVPGTSPPLNSLKKAHSRIEYF